MNKIFYVTTPIYYVNAEPHIGHAYTTILADFMNRFYTMLGYDTYFLTGTDEHGDKIVEAAKANNRSAREYTDAISAQFKKTWEDLGISFNDFIRTTEDRHKKVVQEILQKVYDNGDIYFGSYGGHYCVGCERFLTEKELVDGKCADHGQVPQYIEEKNYFFRMSKYQEWLVGYINENPDFIRPERYRNEVMSMLKGEHLEDLCISRPKSRLTWGIPMPFDDNYVTYVWFDALINYVSALGYPEDARFKKFWPAVQHIIAKDIVKPHGIFWPTMLKAAGLEPYHHLNVHGYWNMEDAKMSKTLGNVITPGDLMQRYGNDQVRYFFLREMVFGNDARFSEDVVIDRVNFDLANDLGNLVKRTFNMVEKYFDGAVPAFSPSSPAGRDELAKKIKDAADGYISYCKTFQTSIGIEKLWEFVRYLNKYIDEKKPWQLDKDGDKNSLASVMRNLLEAIYAIAVLLSPILINISPIIIKALGADGKSRDVEGLFSLALLDDGARLGEMGILFPKMEKPGKEDAAGKAKGMDKADTKGAGKKGGDKNMNEDGAGLLDISEFARVDIRVAKVLEAVRVEGSDKLLELRIDSGLDERTIVAGIAQHYEPDYLVGKKILLVANLKPAVIFKRTSNGMLLAAKKNKGDAPVLIEVDDKIPVGSRLG
ncbi:MAG: methionine--tRNA ligase [Spirochaetae bacterium HGW-Spirochaetae-1]|jgi:methionyl-tRNA synthetase|nr:MAG: methionine--tRNA ligase [Spirochaetae bacterium HGW-Spirochaetae-1]